MRSESKWSSRNSRESNSTERAREMLTMISIVSFNRNACILHSPTKRVRAHVNSLWSYGNDLCSHLKKNQVKSIAYPAIIPSSAYTKADSVWMVSQSTSRIMISNSTMRSLNPKQQKISISIPYRMLSQRYSTHLRSSHASRMAKQDQGRHSRCEVCRITMLLICLQSKRGIHHTY